MDCRSPDHSVCAIGVAAGVRGGLDQEARSTAVGLAAILSIGLVGYVKGHLKNLPVELCGAAEFHELLPLSLIPLALAPGGKLQFRPDGNCAFAMATQPKHAMVGFVIRLDALALILFRFGSWNKPNMAAVRHDEGKKLERLIPTQHAPT